MMLVLIESLDVFFLAYFRQCAVWKVPVYLQCRKCESVFSKKSNLERHVARKQHVNVH
jgi:hypothetical protein